MRERLKSRTTEMLLICTTERMDMLLDDTTLCFFLSMLGFVQAEMMKVRCIYV